MYRACAAVVVVIGAAAFHVDRAQTTASMAIVNARVFTGVETQRWAEAVAIRGNRIIAVGTSQEIREAAGPSARVIEGAGRLVVPGLNDAHTHPGPNPDGVRLEGPPAMQEDPPLGQVVKRLESAAARARKGG